MPAPNVIPGIISSLTELVKELRWPGQGGWMVSEEPGAEVPLNTCTIDQWYPQVGISGGVYNQVPISGRYKVTAFIDVPHFSAVGWSNAYSGEGGCDLWIRHMRGGATITDNIGRFGIALPDDGQHHYMNLGPVYIPGMLKDDKILLIARGGATGYGPNSWDARLTMTKMKS